MSIGVLNLHPSSQFPYLMQVLIDDQRITLRTFERDVNPDPGLVVPVDDVALLLNSHAPCHQSTRCTPNGSWFLSTALGGAWKIGTDYPEGSYLREISQVGLQGCAEQHGVGGWTDRSLWVFMMKRDGSLMPPYNHHAANTVYKSTPETMPAKNGASKVFSVMVPFADQGFSKSRFILNYNPKMGAVHNRTLVRDCPSYLPTSMAQYEEVYGFKNPWPMPKIVGPSQVRLSNAFTEFEIQLVDPNLNDALILDANPYLWIECDKGYVSHRKIRIENGKAKTKFFPLGLAAGETAKLKVNWRLFTGASEHEFSIVP